MIMTVCYIKRDNKTLMLHRTKKENDVNKGKWIGVGGKLEVGESPEECIKREILEETGYTAKNVDFKGIVVFNYNESASEYMHLYTCEDFSGDLIKDCPEGDLRWIDDGEILDLNLWEGDKIFIDLLRKNSPFFYLTLNYRDDVLMDHTLWFKEDGFTRFEVFIPEDYVKNMIEKLGEYSLLDQGFYSNAYSESDVLGHWRSLEGANPFDGEVGKDSSSHEKLIKFRVKKEFEDLAYYIVRKNHPYEVPVINMY